ncbi:putative Na+/H+ antiporter [Brackiella oedipodis]|uniref:putative Na+/H+ antiporter n=1 Tax=Brackiella oedipodis TaxID=124225 RepID=UPI00048CC8A9|nr:putative Na+/H+ antiporter [Brackiella oedipodis]
MMIEPNFIEIIATVLFAVAIIHTFSVSFFANMASKEGPHAGLWHLLSEVEAVFGVWAAILVIFMVITGGFHNAVEYMDSRDFTEPLFVIAIMVIAASRPILELVQRVVRYLSRVIPVQTEVAQFFITLSLVPISGSFITEPAAMTLAALMMRDLFFDRSNSNKYKYITLGVLLVNISIGGVLTHFAAPPVLMVAQKFDWGLLHMLSHFGWRAVIAVVINAALATLICHKEIIRCSRVPVREVVDAYESGNDKRAIVPNSVIAIHVLFLIGVVVSSHHTEIFIGLLMLFIGYCIGYRQYQNRLLIKEAIMVGFFLSGLIVLGGLQQWWLQDLLAGLSPKVLYWGTTALTAITDNAALTYLGSLVQGTDDAWRYMLVAGAVTGGGLTVIANAPNPAGFALLRNSFPHAAISAIWVLLSALIPTLIAAFMFLIFA